MKKTLAEGMLLMTKVTRAGIRAVISGALDPECTEAGWRASQTLRDHQTRDGKRLDALAKKLYQEQEAWWEVGARLVEKGLIARGDGGLVKASGLLYPTKKGIKFLDRMGWQYRSTCGTGHNRWVPSTHIAFGDNRKKYDECSKCLKLVPKGTLAYQMPQTSKPRYCSQACLDLEIRRFEGYYARWDAAALADPETAKTAHSLACFKK